MSCAYFTMVWVFSLTNFEKVVPSSNKFLPRGQVWPHRLWEKDNDVRKPEHFSNRKDELLCFLRDLIIQTTKPGLKYHRAYPYANNYFSKTLERHSIQCSVCHFFLYYFKSHLEIKGSTNQLCYSITITSSILLTIFP